MSDMLARLTPPSRWKLFPAVAIIGLLLCLAIVAFCWTSILDFEFQDPDDALRYVEAQSFANGQGWFDVTQHRVNWPVGGPMHWSRIVDLPIAGLMLLLRPLFGSIVADQIALAVVPVLLFFALCVMTALAVRRLSNTLSAITATLLIGFCFPTIVQFLPMRIDHHGWQILMSAIALWAAFDTQPRRSGIVAGLAVAFWAHVSSEGLPYAAMFLGIFALDFMRDAKAWERLSAYITTLCAGSAAFLLGTRGWPEAGKIYCDAVSPVYVLPMLAAALAMLVTHRAIGNSSWQRRVITPAVAGVTAVAVYLAIGGQCRAGPFSALDPLVYQDWYLKISEGRPVWEQLPVLQAVIIVPPLVGLAGIVMQIVRERDSARQFKWLQMLLLSGGAYVVSLMVMRAMAISYLWSLPGIAQVMIVLLPRAQALKTALKRIVATLGVFCLTPMFLICIAAAILPDAAAPEHSVKEALQTRKCATKAKLQGLASLPRSTILAPLDISPALLAFTPHFVVSTGHHRNNIVMKDVMLAFMEPADKALPIAVRHHADYIAYCAGQNEVGNYIKLGSPNSLMRMLQANRPPPWLTPVSMRSGETIRVYRVSPPPKR